MKIRKTSRVVKSLLTYAGAPAATVSSCLDQKVSFQRNHWLATHQVCRPKALWARGRHCPEIKPHLLPPHCVSPGELYLSVMWRSVSLRDFVISSFWDAVWGCEDGQWKWASGYRWARASHAPNRCWSDRGALSENTVVGPSKLVCVCLCVHAFRGRSVCALVRCARPMHMRISLVFMRTPTRAKWLGVLHLDVTQKPQ